MNSDELLKQLKNAVFAYDEEAAESLAVQCVEQSEDLLACISSLTEAIHVIGEKFGSGELYLPDLIGASQVLEKAMPVLNKGLEDQGRTSSSLGKIVIGTVQGDVHSIGKNIVATLLKAEGFTVSDLGVNVNAAQFIEAVDKENADILALSALLTTTMVEQEKIIHAIKSKEFQVKVIVGGGPVTQEYADKIGADGYESTAGNAAKLVRKLINR